jgi:phosphomannomutase
MRESFAPMMCLRWCADELKLVFNDGSWVCHRFSGTGQVVRVNTEARSERGLEKLRQGRYALDFRVNW